MKKVILLLLAVIGLQTINAQTTPVPAIAAPVEATAPVNKPKTMKVVKEKKLAQVANAAAFACPVCYQITKEGGVCTHCSADKVQLGNYYCAACKKTTGSKAGACGTCKGATTQITRKYCAAHGGTPAKEKKSKELKIAS